MSRRRCIIASVIITAIAPVIAHIFELLQPCVEQIETPMHIADVVITGVAIGSTAANGKINAGSVILQVRDTKVTSPDDVLKIVADERQQKRPFVPMLLAEPSGSRWVPPRLD